jgi:predicted PP-loop superfamily ATPase
MSFQAYIDNIKAKTGKTPDDFKKLAAQKGLLKEGVKAGEIVMWLKKDFELGHGHAMAIYITFKGAKEKEPGDEEGVEKHFSGGKSSWRTVFDALIMELRKFGDDIGIAPTNSYLSILKKNKKFAVIQITTDRMDIGIKLKDIKPNARFEPSGTWNNMVTHRVRIDDPKRIDKELMSWLQDAYNKA